MNAPVDRSILRWFGRRNDTAAGAIYSSAPMAPTAGAEHNSLEEIARRDLLAQITEFLLSNKLVVSETNLLIAHAAFSGSDRRLQRKLEEKRLDGALISQQWLDELVASDGSEANRKDEYEELISRLQSGLDVFTSATKSARKAQGSYKTALEKQVGEMEKVDATGLALASLADIAKTMLDRTRQVEEDMRRSEDEASSLRKSLASAQRDAEIDHLTGLPNRRAFEGVLEREYRDAQAALEPLCVAFCDIDHFKKINDSHGHDTGDRVIQAIGQVLARISNEKCHVARHGGEEFVMLFRGMSKGEAHICLDKARQQLAARNFINRKTDEPIGGITFSGGIADVFGYPDCRAALQAADEALYRAKQQGRNQILIV